MMVEAVENQVCTNLKTFNNSFLASNEPSYIKYLKNYDYTYKEWTCKNCGAKELPIDGKCPYCGTNYIKENKIIKERIDINSFCTGIFI